MRLITIDPCFPASLELDILWAFFEREIPFHRFYSNIFVNLLWSRHCLLKINSEITLCGSLNQITLNGRNGNIKFIGNLLVTHTIKL